jgi:hypothetical protein
MILFLLFCIGFPYENERIIKLDILKEILILFSFQEFQLYDPVVFHWKPIQNRRNKIIKLKWLLMSPGRPPAAGWPVPLGTPVAPKPWANNGAAQIQRKL